MCELSISELETNILLEKQKHVILDQKIKKLKEEVNDNTPQLRREKNTNIKLLDDWNQKDRLIITKELYQYYAKLHNLPKKWKFAFDNACNRCGQTSYRTSTISISKKYINGEKISKAQVVNTILHEIAHALCPGEQHSEVWKRKAQEIGCDGKVCNEIEPFAKATWILRCNKGCCHSERYRRSNVSNKCCLKCRDTVYFCKI